MSTLTEVELTWRQGRVEHWLRFGHEIGERIVDRRRRVVTFAPGAVFGLVRWAANAFGTVVSKLDILRAGEAGEHATHVPGVRPDAESLLRVSGWPKVRRAFEHIDAIEAQGVDPAAIDLDHWRHAHNRFAAGQAPRPYTAIRHRAWLLRQGAIV